MGNRIRTWQPDLGIVYDQFRWIPGQVLPNGHVLAHIEVTVKNFGGTPSPASGATVGLGTNTSALNGAAEGLWEGKVAAVDVPSLAPGESKTFAWDGVELSEELGIYPLFAAVRPPSGVDWNSSNDAVWRHFAR
jgi:hypothetical protein